MERSKIQLSQKVIFSNIPRVAAVVTLVVGLIVMLGWLVDINPLLTLFPGLASMKFNTAFCFFLCGVYLLAISADWNKSSVVWQLLPWAVLFICLLSLFAYQIHLTLFLDEMIVKDPYTAITAYPGRMSPGTGFCFAMVAISLILYDRLREGAEVFTVVAHLIALAAVLGYLFDFGALYKVDFFSTMAIHTAATFIVLTIGTIFVIPGGVIRTLISRNDPSGTATRYLLPAALIIPVVSGWLVWEGYALAFYDVAFGMVLLTLVTVFIMSLLALIYAMSARQWYLHNEQIQHELLVSQIALVEAEKQRELIEIREHFLAMLSHDMRNPITGIIMSSDILLNYQDRLDNEKRQKHLGRIRYQANNIKNLVEDIMLVNRLQQDDFPFEPASGDLVSFCKKLLEEFAELESEKPHKFAGDFPNTAIQMPFDQRLLTRLINNMLRNAVKYSPDGGEISMELAETDGQAVLTISDEGIGIPQEQQGKLFQLFTRASNVGSIAGYGLGLAIVKRIVDVHRGRIEVESFQDKGTTFRVMLPLQSEIPA